MRRALCLGAAIVLLALPALARQTPSRHLAATGVNAFCPDGCTADGCITDGTTAGLRCQKCQGNLIVDKASGRCACPAGKYTNRNVTSCIDCTKGSYCVGGIYNLSNLPDKVACPESMTTLGLRSISQRSCVNLPGFSYAVTADGVSSATVCPVDTYSPGLKKQRGCVPCPTGMTTNGLTGRNTPTACVVPAGYYLKAPGQVAPCPRGEWKSGINTNASCTKCALGVTTPAEGSTAQAACNMVLPGYFAAYIVAGTRTVNKTGICPQKFYCPGGTPSTVFNPEDPTALSASEATIKACPNGMWTQEMGSATVEQCLTPPGYYTANGLTRQCASASYRADWKAAGQATECIVCGVGLLADMTDQLLVFRANGSTFQLPVQTSADDCYIQPGQGLYFQTNTNSWRAKNCDSNVYGVSNKTYGLTPSACRSCPEGMVAVNNNATFPRSTSFFVDNGDGTGGFFSPKACVTKGGYGYNGRIAQPCDQGSYNPQDTWSDCKACPFGTTTAGVGMAAAVVQCSAQIGYGFVSGAVRPCAIGTYNDAINPNTSAPCTSCPTGTTTSKEGGASTADCNRCAAGYGGPSCSTICGGVAEGATYGPAGRAYGSDCLTCSSVGATIGYSFQWQLGNDLFVPRAVSPDAASKSTDCLSEYAQYVDGQYYIPIFPSNTNAQQPNLNNPLDDSGASNGTRTKSAATFQACVDECSANLMCEMVTYDYREKSCTLRVAEVIDIVGAPYIAFKALPSGYTASSAWSLRQKAKQESEAGAKASTSGRYVFWQDWNALEVGTQTAAAGRSSFTGVQDCLNACDDDAECAAVTMQLTVAQTDAPKTCQLVKGSTQPGVFKRTVTRVDLTRLDLPGSYVFLCPSGFASNAGGGCTPITSTQRAALVLTAQGEACNDATKAAILASVKTYLSDPANAPGLYVPSLVIEVDCLEAAARRRQLLAGGGWKTLIFTLNLRFQGSAEAAPAVVSVVEDDPCKVPGMCGGGRFNVTSGSGDASIDVTKAASLSFELASGLSNGHDTPLFLNATVTQSGKVVGIPVVITGSGVTCRRCAQLGRAIYACDVETSVDTLLLNALAINPGGSAPLTATVNLSTVCSVDTVFDIDHCADLNACAFWPCHNGTVEASCNDIPLGANSTEGRTCSCSDGYGYKSEAQGCQDLNACELAPCSADGLATTCEDLAAPAPGNATGRTCGCNAATAAYSEEGGCVDLNACTFWPCANGTAPATCNDTLGGANSTEGRTCSCPAGFYYKDETDGCMEIDACLYFACAANDLANATCADKVGGANSTAGRTCSCPAGSYYKDETDGCMEIDACLYFACAANDLANATCADKVGGANSTAGRTCSCPAGSYYKDETDGCMEIDACLYFACAANDLANATCADKVGGANSTAGRTCSCPAGSYYKDETDGCMEIDACLYFACAANDLANATCADKVGGANSTAGRTCSCPAGSFYKDETDGCMEIDACLYFACAANDLANATCADKVGGANSTAGRTCSCPAGSYYKDETDGCMEIDACLYFACAANDLANATCADKVGGANSTAGRTCTCAYGWIYKDDVDGCVNIDACLAFPCISVGFTNATCIDAPGGANTTEGRTCDCGTGAYYNETHGCIDVPGCYNQPCLTPEVATCHDVAAPGDGFTCTCPAGYHAYNATSGCDVDACVASPCNQTGAANATCSDILGGPNNSTGRECSCGAGFAYAGDSTGCVGVVDPLAKFCYSYSTGSNKEQMLIWQSSGSCVVPGDQGAYSGTGVIGSAAPGSVWLWTEDPGITYVEQWCLLYSTDSNGLRSMLVPAGFVGSSNCATVAATMSGTSIMWAVSAGGYTGGAVWSATYWGANPGGYTTSQFCAWYAFNAGVERFLFTPSNGGCYSDMSYTYNEYLMPFMVTAHP